MDGTTLSLNSRPRDSGDGALAPASRATRSLVLWSGGVDSTYCLLRLLQESRDAVFSHHVVLLRPDPRGENRRGAYQAAAVARLRPALAAMARPFQHTESRVDLSRLGAAGGDAALLGFMAAQAAISHGFTPFDRVLVGVNGDQDPGWQPDTAACALRRARLARALRAAWGCDEVPHVYLWEPRPDKVQMVEYLGPALTRLTVSCLRPIPGRENDDGSDGGLAPCGECAKCSARGIWDGRASASPRPASAPATRSPPLFHQLEAALSRRPAPAGAAAATDPPAP